MATFDITSLSSKGQIVIPNNLRKELGMTPGIKLIIFTDGSNLLIKPVPSPKIETFQKLIKESRALVKKNKFTASDVEKIIKQTRNENRS
jgi:antitoxin PrlF